jgi:hypothetical protein
MVLHLNHLSPSKGSPITRETMDSKIVTPRAHTIAKIPLIEWENSIEILPKVSQSMLSIILHKIFSRHPHWVIKNLCQ